MTDSQRTRHTILLVDDDNGLRAALAVNFRAMGFEVLEAETAEEALEIGERTSGIALVLSDLRLPNMSGRELLQRLHAIRPVLPFIVITGYTSEGVDVLIRDGAYTVLSKPIDPRKLMLVVNRAVSAPATLVVEGQGVDAIGPMLAGAGVTIHTAATLDEAVTTLRNANIDVVIVDTSMTGVGALDEIRRANPEARLVVVFTGDSRPLRRIAAAAGAFTYLQRPASPAHLLQVLSRARAATEVS
jgi:DNA-binding NtrC family response regulator